MTFKQRQLKAKELSKLIGDFVVITTDKVQQMAGENMEDLKVSNKVFGFVIDVTVNYVYLGEDLNSGYSNLVDINECYHIEITEPSLVVLDGEDRVEVPPKGDQH